MTELLALARQLVVVLPLNIVFWCLSGPIALPLFILDRFFRARQAQQTEQSFRSYVASGTNANWARHLTRRQPFIGLPNPDLEQLKRLDPLGFEEQIAAAFARCGWEVRTTARSGDEGVDLLLQKVGSTAVVQCKRYAGSVGAPIVRDRYGAMVHLNATLTHLVTLFCARSWCPINRR